MWLGALLAIAAPGALLTTTACKEPAAPGTLVGSFAMTGTLEENSCGQGLAPSPSISFVAELRRSDTVAYWRMNGAGPRSQGRIDADGDFLFQQQSQVDGWPADELNGIPPCRFVQTETIEGHVELEREDGDAGAPDAGAGDAGAGDAGASGPYVMSATNEITIAVVPGFDCSLALVSSGAGGQFAALPCSARYSLTGESGE